MRRNKNKVCSQIFIFFKSGGRRNGGKIWVFSREKKSHSWDDDEGSFPHSLLHSPHLCSRRSITTISPSFLFLIHSHILKHTQTNINGRKQASNSLQHWCHVHRRLLQFSGESYSLSALIFFFAILSFFNWSTPIEENGKSFEFEFTSKEAVIGAVPTISMLCPMPVIFS